jgi:carboxypeptidase Taq
MSGDAYSELVEKFKRLAQLDHAMTFLQWDQLVMMPPAGNDARADSIAELASLHHEMLTADKMGELIRKAGEQLTDPTLKRSLFEMEREWQQAVCLPSSLVKAQSLAGSKCEHGWRSQRKNNDWQGFLKNFEEVVRLSREEAQLRQAVDSEKFPTPYDALLDLYCTGDSSEFIQELFTGLKAELPDLLQEVLERQRSSVELSGSFPIDAQKKLNEKLMSYLGFDFDAGRLDVSMHPFSTGGKGDHRITTRFREDGFADALQGTAHETGHASYESGLPQLWENLPVGEARNMCIHESQSLLFEKQLFLSKPFITFFTPAIHNCLPDGRRFDCEQVWHACIRVQPSFIRVDADEVTYPLHIILRFEIERDLMNGVIEPKDIPELWNEKMQQYLGLSTDGNYHDGCLQDIHWTDGSFGYFPSYTLGALNSAQLFATIRKQQPEWQDMLKRGEVAFVRNWLRTAIWNKGSTMESQDIIRAATGEGTEPKYFLDHIKARYINNEY